MALLIAPDVRLKLARKTPPVTREEIIQCFTNRTGRFLEDTREQHKTDPPTMWFISETDYGRRLKVCFLQDANDTTIKSAFEPNEIEERIYSRKGRQEQRDEQSNQDTKDP